MTSRLHRGERLTCIAIAVVAMGACSVAPLGATPDGLAKAQAGSPPGADAFLRECSRCHGKRGEGLAEAPPLIGSGALPLYPRDSASSISAFTPSTTSQTQQDVTRIPGQPKRHAFRTAQDVFEYVSTRMPLPTSRAGTLKPEEYWAIVNFVLLAHGAPVPAGGITASNATSVAIRP
jgi:mono/diheme cytochrome c family protein